MKWRNRPLLEPVPKPEAGLATIRLKEAFQLKLAETVVYFRPAGFTMQLPEYEATMMVRNGLAEQVAEPLLPHLFAKKRQDT